MSRSQNQRSGPRAPRVSSDNSLRGDGDLEKNTWSSLLDSVASGKKLPEKNLIVFGGSSEVQKEFIDILAADNTPKRPQDRARRKPPTANDFALGYTYLDVLDADHEDLLARLSLYLLSEPEPAFASLVKPRFNPRSIPESLVVILLDWAEPWRWIGQLRDWIRFLRSIIDDVDEETHDSTEMLMKEWQQRKRGRPYNETAGNIASTENNVTILLGQGEWDEPLGLPLCVVCHGANKIDDLEAQQGWREEDFDFVLQFLRTVLMKHGSSLVYTSTSSPNSLPTLIHSSLGIQSLLKKQILKHNVIDRDKILIPPNWDSWGKIRVLREGFDVEGISKGWSRDIMLPHSLDGVNGSLDAPAITDDTVGRPTPHDTVLSLYEETIRDTRRGRESGRLKLGKSSIDLQAPNMQAFLAIQQEIMERLKKEEEQAAAAAQEKERANKLTTGSDSNPTQPSRYFSSQTDSGAISDQIGPVQFNMGGIQVDADDMLQRLKSREGGKGEIQTPNAQTPTKTGIDEKANNEQLQHFFSSLMKKDRSGSPYSRKTDEDR